MIAVQITRKWSVVALISLGFSIARPLSQNQVHRWGAKVAEGYFLL